MGAAIAGPIIIGNFFFSFFESSIAALYRCSTSVCFSTPSPAPKSQLSQSPKRCCARQVGNNNNNNNNNNDPSEPYYIPSSISSLLYPPPSSFRSHPFSLLPSHRASALLHFFVLRERCIQSTSADNEVAPGFAYFCSSRQEVIALFSHTVTLFVARFQLFSTSRRPHPCSPRAGPLRWTSRLHQRSQGRPIRDLRRPSRIIVRPHMRLYLEPFDSGQLPHSHSQFVP